MTPENALSITAYGAVADGRDNTASIQNAIDAAKLQGKTVWVPTGEFKHGGVLKLNGVKIAGEGDNSVLAGTDRQNMALMLSGDGAGVSSLKLVGPDGVRYAAWEACGISVLDATNFTIRDVTIERAGAAGMHMSGSSGGTIEGNTLRWTGADSIHHSNILGANQNIVVTGNRSENSGDDGVAVVSYQSNPEISHHITIENNTVVDQELGRGYAVVGGHDITIRNNHYDNNKSNLAGAYVSAESYWDTHGAYNVWVQNNTIKNAGGHHGSIHVFADGNPVHQVYIEGNQIYNSRNDPVVTNGSDQGYDLTITNNKAYGAHNNFVSMYHGTETIESNNTISPLSAYPGDMVKAGSGSQGYSPEPPTTPEEPVDPPPSVPIPAEGDWVLTPAPTKIITGHNYNETMRGTDAHEKFVGRGGQDTMIGSNGGDTFLVNSAGDKVIEYAGQGADQIILSHSAYTMPAHAENLTIDRDRGASVTGNSEDNTIIGDIGRDTIRGGFGADKMTGAGGNDTFVFRKGEAAGDLITDFRGNGANAGDILRFEGFGADAKLTHNGDHWAVSHAGGSEVLTISGVQALASGDFGFF